MDESDCGWGIRAAEVDEGQSEGESARILRVGKRGGDCGLWGY